MNPQCCSIPRKAIKHSLITEALNKNRDIPAEDVFEQLCTISNLIPYYKPCHAHKEKVTATTSTDSTTRKRIKLEFVCPLCSDKMNSKEALERHEVNVHGIIFTVPSGAN